jgi:hypothetical protein
MRNFDRVMLKRYQRLEALRHSPDVKLAIVAISRRWDGMRAT